MRLGLILQAAATISLSSGLSLADEKPRLLSLQTSAAPKEKVEGSAEKPWHLEFGLRDGCTKLAETKKMLDQHLETPLRLDWLNYFDEPTTPLDRKSEFALITAYFGAGRQESDWLIWTMYVGGGMWRDHDHQRVYIQNLEVNFKYAYVYTGASLAIYPWKSPEFEDFSDFRACVLSSRPFISTGVESGYVSAEGRGNYKIAPYPRIYQDKVQVRDWITSLNFGLGWHLPLSRSWSVVLIGDYRFHFYRADEYNGWTLTTGLRYNLP